jgi:hypothetical protein
MQMGFDSSRRFYVTRIENTFGFSANIYAESDRYVGIASREIGAIVCVGKSIGLV